MGSYLMNGMIFPQSVVVFSLLYGVSLVVTLGCDNWFLIWVGLEINMMSFIVLVYDYSLLNVELSMKYFFIQSIGSGILVMMFYSEFMLFEYISLSVLSYKMGAGPFYFWFPNICDMMGWGGCLMLMTVQKVLPLLIMSFLVSGFLWAIIVISLIVGAFGSFNQKRVKRLMSYSSIHHVGWILAGNFIGESVWLIYLFLYSLLIVAVVNCFMKDKILGMGSLSKLSCKWSFVLSMLSMGGMPPFLGFYLKWWLFYQLLFIDFVLMLLMVLMSVLMFYVYLRIVYTVITGGASVEGWSVVKSGFKVFSFDLLFVLGVNVGALILVVL